MKRIRERRVGTVGKSQGEVIVRDGEEPVYQKVRRLEVFSSSGRGDRHAVLSMTDVDDLIAALREMKEDPGE